MNGSNTVGGLPISDNSGDINTGQQVIDIHTRFLVLRRMMYIKTYKLADVQTW